MGIQLNPEQMLGVQAEDTDVTVSKGKWLESVIQKLSNPELTPAVEPGKGFKGKLREYQQKGLEMLGTNFSIKKLPTRNQGRASSLLKGNILERTSNLTTATRRLRHRRNKDRRSDLLNDTREY